jgi:hypothetical protein
MQTGFSETLIGWKSGKTTYVPLWDRMEGAWLWTQWNSNDFDNFETRKWMQNGILRHIYIYIFRFYEPFRARLSSKFAKRGNKQKLFKQKYTMCIIKYKI